MQLKKMELSHQNFYAVRIFRKLLLPTDDQIAACACDCNRLFQLYSIHLLQFYKFQIVLKLFWQ
jgi:hypothetical protein